MVPGDSDPSILSTFKRFPTELLVGYNQNSTLSDLIVNNSPRKLLVEKCITP